MASYRRTDRAANWVRVMGSRRSCPFRWDGNRSLAMASLTRLAAQSSTGSPGDGDRLDLAGALSLDPDAPVKDGVGLRAAGVHGGDMVDVVPIPDGELALSESMESRLQCFSASW